MFITPAKARLLQLSALAVLAIGSISIAQSEPTLEQLKKQYEDALNQLKQQTDRKNELAQENQKLETRLSDLEKQVADLKAKDDENLNENYYLRLHRAAWEAFMELSPAIKAGWTEFIALQSVNTIYLKNVVGYPNWPFDVPEKIELPVSPFTSPTTQSTTLPTTQPTIAPASLPTTHP